MNTDNIQAVSVTKKKPYNILKKQNQDLSDDSRADTDFHSV